MLAVRTFTHEFPPIGDVRERHLEESLRAVDGWLHRGEAVELHESARVAAEHANGRPIVVVEIGSYHGRSTIALALGLREGGTGVVHAIDPQSLDADQLTSLKHNLKAVGVDDLVDVIVSTSHEARPRFEDASVDVLFVDGSHDYADVMQDIADWTPSLRPGAIAAFNDPYWVPVGRAMRDGLAQRGSSYRNPRWTNKTVFFDFRPDAPWTFRDSISRARLRAYLKAGRAWWVIHERFVMKYLPLRRRLVPIEIRLAYGVFAVLLPRVRHNGTW